MQKTNEMKIDILSRSENESLARVVVAAFFSQIDSTVDELYDVKMAVSEAVTNSIIHGYEEDGTKKITLKCTYVERVGTIEIIDEGKGIEDVEKAMKAMYTTSPDDERAGLGFTVMESMMDTIEVSSKVGKGTTVRLTKTFL